MDDLDFSVLLWLLPSNIHPDTISADINALQEIIDDVRFYNDPDKCFDYLTTIKS